MEFIGKDSDEEGEEVQEQTKPIADVKDVNNDDQSPSSSSSTFGALLKARHTTRRDVSHACRTCTFRSQPVAAGMRASHGAICAASYSCRARVVMTLCCSACGAMYCALIV